jgi:hypothetical protein
VIRFAFVSLLTLGALGGVMFLSASQAETNAAPKELSKSEALFR